MTAPSPHPGGAALPAARCPALLAAAAIAALAWAGLACSAPGRPPAALAAAPAPDPAAARFAVERRDMVYWQLRDRGITDPRVLAAMRRVPRHRFVPAEQRPFAYDDRPLPIGHGQTISQPYVVALMCQLLELDAGDRVLEIGTGSGYHAAVLAELAARVYSIEIVEPLAAGARRTLADLGYDNVEVRAGDGYGGWPSAAPFDAILLTAAPARIPQPLLDQLAEGGRLLAPVGDGDVQQLVRVTRGPGGDTRERVVPVRFVPMTGRAENGRDRPGPPRTPR